MLEPSIHWMTFGDAHAVASIEAKSFARPWDLATLRRRCCGRRTICMVAKVGEGIVGHMVYTLSLDLIELERIAVAPTLRRQGVGRALVHKLRQKLVGPVLRNRIGISIPERLITTKNLEACEFFRAMGFHAHVSHGREEDSWRFVYRLSFADATRGFGEASRVGSV